MPFTFDANGNQTGCGDDVFVYDDENRLIKAEVGLGETSCWDLAEELGLTPDDDDQEGSTSTYVYNGDGLRVAQTVTVSEENDGKGEEDEDNEEDNGDDEEHPRSRTTSYVWDIAAALPVVIDDGENRYVYGLDLIAALDGTDKASTYLHDGLDSVVAIVPEQSGDMAALPLKYDVFGAKVGGPTSPGGFGFTGQQHDAATGFLYLRTRHYNPVTGRFMTQDIHSGWAQVSQSINKFVYVRNNPSSLIDITGLAAAYSGCAGGLYKGVGGSIDAKRFVEDPFTSKTVVDTIGFSGGVGLGFDGSCTGGVASDTPTWGRLFWIGPRIISVSFGPSCTVGAGVVVGEVGATFSGETQVGAGGGIAAEASCNVIEVRLKLRTLQNLQNPDTYLPNPLSQPPSAMPSVRGIALLPIAPPTSTQK